MEHLFAQIDAAGVCFAASRLSAQVDAPNMVRLPDGVEPADYLGRKFDAKAKTWGAGKTQAEADKEAAAAELLAIDVATGTSRAVREVLIAIGQKVGADVAFLAGKEAAAVAARVKLKG